jgi:hypothetical protein
MPESQSGSHSGPMSPEEVIKEMIGLSHWIGIIHKAVEKHPNRQLKLGDLVSGGSVGPDPPDNLMVDNDCIVLVPPEGGPVTIGDLVRILDALHGVCNNLTKRVEEIVRRYDELT